MQTLYDVLKVQEDAPLEVIRAAYKVLSSKYHPDKNPGDPAASEMMQKINRAYNILRDPEARARYDAALKQVRDQQQTETTTSHGEEMEASMPSSDTSASPSSNTPARQSFGEAVARIWSGRMGLCKTYWLYGVLGGCLWGIALGFAATIVNPGGGPAIAVGLAFFVYVFVIYVGVWRSANFYTGPTIWAHAARFICILPVIGIIAAVSLPAYQDYKTQANLNRAVSEIEWGKGDLLTPSQSKSQIEELLKDAPAYQPPTLPQEYQSRVAALRRAAEIGKLPIVNIRQSSAADGVLNEWTVSEVATIENWQTWWTSDDVVGLHVTNLSARKMSMLEIKHAPTQCELTTNGSFSYYTLPLERPVEPGTQAIIRFTTNGHIPPTNGCLIIARIRG